MEICDNNSLDVDEQLENDQTCDICGKNHLVNQCDLVKITKQVILHLESQLNWIDLIYV